MKNLPNVTLVAVGSTRIKETVKALKRSMSGIIFGEVLFITNEKISLENLGIKVINIEKLDYVGYNHFMIYRLKDYVKTEFALSIQHDGYVLRPNKWNDVFLQYDYIGAPWIKNVHFTKDGTNIRVGNGGFSLRSMKLLSAPDKLGLPFTKTDNGSCHEDGIICVHYRKELENYGIKFAPIDVAAKFSFETLCEESDRKAFGFHNNKMVTVSSLMNKILRKIKNLIS